MERNFDIDLDAIVTKFVTKKQDRKKIV